MVNPYKEIAKQPVAPPKSKIVIKGGRQSAVDVNSLKDKVLDF